MIILISGESDAAAKCAERLRNHMSYRGMACITYDFEEPAHQMHDGAMIALQTYGAIIDLPIKDVFAEPRCDRLEGFIKVWLERRVPLREIAQARIESMTARWKELKMLYVVIIHGDMIKKDIGRFKASYSVRLNCSELESCPELGHFDDCAVSDIFDLVVDTNKMSFDEAATLIGESFNDKIVSMLHKTTDEPVQDAPKT